MGTVALGLVSEGPTSKQGSPFLCPLVLGSPCFLGNTEQALGQPGNPCPEEVPRIWGHTSQPSSRRVRTWGLAPTNGRG